MTKQMTKEEKFKLLNPEYPKTVVTDMDGVLVDIDFVWCLKILANRKIFDPYFNLDEKRLKNIIHVVSRREYYLEQWLKKDEIAEIPFKIKEAFLKLYDTPDFYKICPPSPFGTTMRDYVFSKQCKKLYVLTDCTSTKSADDKYYWLARLFDAGYNKMHEKVVFVPIINSGSGPKIKKSDVINNEKIDYDVFIEDLLPNVIDVAKNTNSEGKEFNIIRKGYNEETDELAAIADLKSITVNYITLSYKLTSN